MNKFNFHLEYIWLDGNYPQQIRSKTKIVDKIKKPSQLASTTKAGLPTKS